MQTHHRASETARSYCALGYHIHADITLEGLAAVEPASARGDPVSFRFVREKVAWPPVDGGATFHPECDVTEALPANALVLADRGACVWDWYTSFDDLPMTRVRCDLAERSITMSCGEDLDGFRVSYHLVSPVLPYWARRDGRLGLHAAVVAVDGSAVVILGDKTLGKSTLCAAFHKAGYPLWSDDVAAIAPDLRSVYRGSGMLRTSEDTARAILGDGVRLRKCSFSKHVVDTDPASAAGEPEALPISAIFHLSPFSDDPSSRIMRLHDPLARMAVLRNLGSTAFPAPPAIREGEFRAATALAGATPVFSVMRPRDLAVLPETVDQILRFTREADEAHVE